ncbi:MAG: MFS transporter, partial [Chloroflexota bacterium]|nr:MFS transporter [Chloroflexota bacterium]
MFKDGFKDIFNFKMNNWIVAVAICSGMFISVLDNSSIHIALPKIALQFNAQIPEVQWLAIGYGLVSGALILPMGRLSDLVGRKRIYLTGFLISGLTAIMTSIAPSLTLAILFRGLQGVGGAMIQANAMAILISSFPSSRRGLIIGIFMTTVGVASVIGPVFGGLIVQYFSWRWLLFIPSPLGLTAFAVGYLILPHMKPGSSDGLGASKFDWIGSLYFAVALCSLMLTITNGHRLGWLSPIIICLLIGFLVFAILFVVRQARTDSPLIALELLSRKYFSFGSLASLFTF